MTATIGVYDARGQLTAARSPQRELAAGTVATVVTSQAYDAFGEVTRSTDARGGRCRSFLKLIF